MCQCGLVNDVDYTDETLRDVLLAGIADLDIRHEALSVEGMNLKAVNDVISYMSKARKWPEMPSLHKSIRQCPHLSKVPNIEMGIP